ncbi:MAG: hypothetical protein BGO06_26260 [Shinella sp. 65-6]|nr:MAG: hypothetical protein BGO06_26260 [Shinella sp. 65-6]
MPGAAVCARIAEVVDSEGRIPADAIPRFASRLSGVSEGKICRLPLIDRTAIRHAVEGLFMEERRRQSARKASSRATVEGARNE